MVNTFNEAASYSLVKETIKNVCQKYKFDENEVQFLALGGQSVLFLIRRTKQILKIPSYIKRPSEEHFLLKHGIIKEGEVLRYCDSNFVPSLFDVSSEGEYLIREYIEGYTLMKLVKNINTHSQDKKIMIEKLFYMAKHTFKDFHENKRGNYVIRDFKPANIVYDETGGRFFLVDVGSIRPESDMVAKTSNPYRLGSGKWLHWSPEQLLGKKEELDRRTDYFAFGSTAYYVLTGSAPFSNSETNPERIIDVYLNEYKTVTKTLKKLNDKLQIYPQKMDFIIKCLYPLPSKRAFDFANA